MALQKTVLLLTFSCLLSALAMPIQAAPAKTVAEDKSTSPQQIAQDAAKLWLAEVDGDQYGKAWDRAASLFQNEVTREKWEINMIRIRGLLGSAEKRKLVSATPRQSLPGMPDGDYVVITWSTKFEHKARALELITVTKEKGEQWKVVGYVIR